MTDQTLPKTLSPQYNLTADIGDNFCYAPWTNIHIDSQGEYKTCCAGQSSIGNLKTTNITDILNSRMLTEIKTALLDNHPHANCLMCYRQEERSSSSERAWYSNIAERRVIPIQRVEDQQLQNLDIRWSNTCNLSCVYCDAGSSSQWAQLTGWPIERLDYTNTLPGIVEHINNNRATIKNIALLGGEPLLQKENEQLLAAIADDVHINIITNLSVPLAKNKIFQRLITMKNVTWDISFETLGDKFEYVRHGASWSTLINNIQLLQQYTDRVNVTGQYSVYNCLNFAEVNQYFFDKNISVRWNELIYPTALSPFNLPDEFMKRSAKELLASKPYTKHAVQQQLFKQLADNLMSRSNPDATTATLYKWHEEQEQKYWPTGLKFADLWPEFSVPQ